MPFCQRNSRFLKSVTVGENEVSVNHLPVNGEQNFRSHNPQSHQESHHLCKIVTSGNVTQLHSVIKWHNVDSTHNQMSLLMHAVKANKTSTDCCVQFLLSINADAAFSTSGTGDTCMHVAVTSGNTRVMHLLHSRCPALLKMKNHLGDTPVMLAAKIGDVKAIEKLMELGSDVSDTNLCGQNAGDLAFYFQFWECYACVK
jgi:ankyrin repeat protein